MSLYPMDVIVINAQYNDAVYIRIGVVQRQAPASSHDVPPRYVSSASSGGIWSSGIQ